MKLEIIKGKTKDKGKSFEMVSKTTDNITVGRSARKSERYGEGYPHIQLSSEDRRLSRWHFMIQCRPPDNFYIYDLGSTNHTYVNDFKVHIKAALELKDGDTIKAGRTYLKVSLVPGEPKEPPAYTCAKCNKELKELEGKPLEEIRAEDFICEKCQCRGRFTEEEKEKKKKPRVEERPKKQKVRESSVEKEVEKEKPIVSEKVILRCFSCSKDVSGKADKDGKANEFRDIALYLCDDCAYSEREMKEKISGYVFLREIGRGGMGVVYKAWHKPTARIVAIKELLPDKLMDERALKVFLREISVTHDLIHPNIVRFYDSFTKRKRPYLVTEYLPGGSAEDMLLKHKKPLSDEKACGIILEVLDGLSHAHKRKFVHRDISPHNILFDNNGRAKLSDMGLAKSIELAGQSGITAPGETGGKILYIAPEQIRDFCFVKPPADVYSVGVCMYYFLTGKFPYHFPTALDILMGQLQLIKIKHPFTIILDEEPIPIRERNPDISESLAAVIDRCLRKMPDERYGDGGELKKAITIAMN